MLASRLAPLALASGQLDAEAASRVALGACGVIDAALRSVLQQDDSGSEPSVHGSPMHAALPTPAFVAAAAALAAQTVSGLAAQQQQHGYDGGAAAAVRTAEATSSSVTDTMLSVCEDCIAAVAELGVGDRASDALLNICLAIARQLAPLLALAGEQDANALQDLLPRLHAVLVRTRVKGQPCGPCGMLGSCISWCSTTRDWGGQCWADLGGWCSACWARDLGSPSPPPLLHA